MSADEIFEKLRYEKDITKQENCGMIIYKKEPILIAFSLIHENITIMRTKGLDNMVHLSTKTIQAINKKCEELGWTKDSSPKFLSESDECYITCEYCGGRLYEDFICSKCGLKTKHK